MALEFKKTGFIPSPLEMYECGLNKKANGFNYLQGIVLGNRYDELIEFSKKEEYEKQAKEVNSLGLNVLMLSIINVVDEKIIDFLIKSLNLFDILKQQTIHGNNFLLLAISNNDYSISIAKKFIEMLSFEQFYTILQQQNEDGDNVIMLSALYERTNYDIIDILIRNLDNEQLIKLLICPNKKENNAIMRLVYNTNLYKLQILNKLLINLDINQKMKVLQHCRSDGAAVFMSAFGSNDFELDTFEKMIEILTNGLNKDQIFECLKYQTNINKHNFIIYAIQNNSDINKRERIIMMMFEKLDNDQISILMRQQDESGNNALIEAIEKGYDELVDIFIPLSDLKQIDCYGNNALIIAAQKASNNIVKKILAIDQTINNEKYYKYLYKMASEVISEQNQRLSEIKIFNDVYNNTNSDMISSISTFL